MSNQPLRLGIVGAGQLARMTIEAAAPMSVPVAVLAEHRDDAACALANDVLLGDPGHPGAMAALSAISSVVTFDHEQVDLDVLRQLEESGAVVRPSTSTLEFTTDKAVMRQRLGAAGLPMPIHDIFEADHARNGLVSFAARVGYPFIAKAARGGYDGKGVFVIDSEAAMEEFVDLAERTNMMVLAEEFVDIDAELAVVVARRPDGQMVTWPVVETAQVDGVCREVLVPGRFGRDGPNAELVRAAGELAERTAELVGAVGVLAVEMFARDGTVVINELAARPHNSGHWTIEGAVTSQFENHLRAVLDLPLGSVEMAAPSVAMVNVFGADDGGDPLDHLDRALAVEGAHVHLYGKAPRPGRKLGHVTVVGSSAHDVRTRAWQAAKALGTTMPISIASTGDQ